MNANELLQLLQAGFAASGTFDAGALPGNPCAALLERFGLPLRLPLRSNTGWVSDGTGLSLNGTTSETLLGVRQPSVFLHVQQVEGQWALLLGINLPFNWTFRQSFPTSPHAILDAFVCRSLLVASAAMNLALDWLLQAAEPQASHDPPSGEVQTLTTSVGVSLYGWDAKASGLVNVDTLAALLDQRALNVMVAINASGLPDAATLNNFYGADNGVAQGLPTPCINDPTLLRLNHANCAINPATRAIILANLALDAFDGESWDIWPGVIALSDVHLRFSTVRTAAPPSLLAFNLDALFTLGGLPLLIKARLPVASLSGGLPPGTPPQPLKPFAQALFGHSSVLPDDLWISQLDFRASIPRSLYGAELAVNGALRFEFGEDHEIVFEQLQLAVNRDAKGTEGHLKCTFSIDQHNHFAIDWSLAGGNTVFNGAWKSPDQPLPLNRLLDALGLPGLPDLPGGLELGLSEASFTFDSSTSAFVFSVHALLYDPDAPASGTQGSATFVAGRTARGDGWGFIYGMLVGLDLKLNLTQIPLVGELLPAGGDSVRLERLRLLAASKALPAIASSGDLDSLLGGPVSSGVALSADLQVGDLPRQTLAVSFGGDAKPQPPAPAQRETLLAAAPAALANDTPAADSAPKVCWISVQRAFGPVQIQRLGFTVTAQGALGVLFDAAVDIRGLSIGLSGLEADIPLRAPFYPGFGLSGLAVQYESPSLSISGALGKSPGIESVQYTGELSLSAGTFGATALGSYTTVNGSPSLMAFAFINTPLGGPPYFFVTGMAGGLGYNRSLTLPGIDQLESFPLIKGAMGHIDAATTRQQLDSYIRPVDGQDWFAAGVRFTSFEMLKSFALLTLSFGTRTEIALLGQSSLTIPPSTAGKPKDPVAQADLLIRVCLQIDEGLLAVNAQLSPSSYVFSRDARLTGGFAFYLWFGNSPHAGDFVVTLGGYNPHFNVPAHYPRVPRLGLNWRISDDLTIKGELYFALTPSVIMAGGLLDATWQSGGVKAWFSVQANFLIRFKPFAYWIDASISIGVSVRVNLWITSFTLTLHVGVGLQLWGPTFGGQATVHLWIVSFTIDFGSSRRPGDNPIGWDEFRDSFLPSTREHAARLEQAPGAAVNSALINISAPVGILSTCQHQGEPVWTVNGASLQLVLATQIPSTHVAGSAAPGQQHWTSSLGVGPMGKAPGALKSVLSVTITRDGEADDDAWESTAVLGGVPSGLWSNTGNGIQNNAVITDALQGLTLVPTPPRARNRLTVGLKTLLEGNPTRIAVAWSSARPAVKGYTPADPMGELQRSLLQPDVAQRRHDLLGALARQGQDTRTEVQLDAFASRAADLLLDAPVFSALGGNA